MPRAQQHIYRISAPRWKVYKIVNNCGLRRLDVLLLCDGSMEQFATSSEPCPVTQHFQAGKLKTCLDYKNYIPSLVTTKTALKRKPIIIIIILTPQAQSRR